MKKAGVIVIPIFVLILLLTSFRFSFFMTYIKLQKNEFRATLLKSTDQKIKHFRIDKSLLYKNHKLKTGELVEWEHNNKELVIAGVYHEVVAINTEEDHVLISLMEDKEENALFQKYITIKQENSKDVTVFLSQIFNFNYLSHSSGFTFFILHASTCIVNESSPKIFKVFLSPAKKPPRALKNFI